MLVYGDHSETADPRQRLERIAEQIAAVADIGAGIGRHARLVGALADAGQLLQGVADADFGAVGADRRTPGIDALSGYVCAIAGALCRSWDSGFVDTGELPAAPLGEELPLPVELRTPEGFAFYAVYPEAYIAAARQLRLSGSPRVIGIRSIGTTLGATVAAALGASTLVTLRPDGDPFARRVTIAPELERELLEGDPHYVIVDEGPGQSGSSFGAVADWLEARGVPLERIAFLPSHSGAPGAQASETHRARWNAAQRAVADFGVQLPKLVREWTSAALAPVDAPLADISVGEWRRHVYSREADWPAAMPVWERRKFLASADGEKLLLKFAGLGAIGERKLAMARALHAAGCTAEPLGLVHGFLVERWCDGQRLDPDAKAVADIARYIATRARLFPAADNSGATLGQLLETSRRNIALTLGDTTARLLDSWGPRLGALSRRLVRVRTDNRLDRHEWLRLPGGRLLKTDALDHHAAHDLVGCQDMAWDVAGAMLEFALDAREADALIEASGHASGRHVDRELLEFYRVAYPAFRLGQASLAAQMCGSGAAETARLRAAADRYASELKRLLLESRCAATRPESLVG
jgi:hypothetical protein